MSAAKRKAAPAPDMGGLTDDWQKMTSLRQGEHGRQEAPTPAAPVMAPAPEASRSGPGAMTRRSWYASADAVEALAKAVDDIHHATRAPKHAVVSELFRAAAAAAPHVQQKLAPKE
ncbi:hypothetical protein HUT17_05520 (plasmid) [Nocardiopsis flavescens]|nr:hypothetical protein HUT17_05445 [Nocardiopsis flavescens]QKW32595.1 hypothetical protein HUT17_05520 [Nocardiopsis flavescens]